MKVRERPAFRVLLAWTALLVGSCSWLEKPEPPQDGPAQPRFVRVSDAYGEQGGDTVRLHRYELEGSVPAAKSDPLDLAKALLAKEVLKQQAGDDSIDADVAPGQLLARIWTVFGPPHEGRPDEQFNYTFLDTRTRLVFNVWSWEAGDPRYQLAGTYAGALPPPASPDAHFVPDRTPQWLAGLAIPPNLGGPGAGDSQRAASDMVAQQKKLQESARAFEAFLADKPLADCALVTSTDFGLYRIGAKDGAVLNEQLSFAESIDFYLDVIARNGPTRDVPVFNLARPQLHILFLWAEASAEERASRPQALAHAREGWRREVEDLSRKIVLEERDQSDWELAFRVLSSQAALLEVDASAVQALERLRQAPPVPKLSEVERGILQSALWAKEASRHWSDEERARRVADDKQMAARGPEYDPAQIVARLGKSETASDRQLAAQLEQALFAR